MNEQTRYRVTGALFLLAIAIVVLPMVFDGQGVRVKQLPELSEPLPPMPTSAELDALEIPQAEVDDYRAEQEVTAGLLDADGFETDRGTRIGDPVLREVPADAAAGTIARAESSEPDPAADAMAAADAPRAAETKPQQAAAAVADAPPTTASSVPARRAPAVPAARPGGTAKSLAKRPIWAVQLASFASPVNATALRDKLLEGGFEAWTSTARQDGVVRTRVAIGPLLDRRDAERMRDLVSGRYSVSAIVVHMEP